MMTLHLCFLWNPEKVGSEGGKLLQHTRQQNKGEISVGERVLRTSEDTRLFERDPLQICLA
jgi:hypothetical protein